MVRHTADGLKFEHYECPWYKQGGRLCKEEGGGMKVQMVASDNGPGARGRNLDGGKRGGNSLTITNEYLLL